MARQWIAPEYGDIDVLRFVDTEAPAPGPGEVTISVRAAGVNPVDFKLVAGGPNADRSQLPLPIGQELAGVVTAIGPGTRIGSGDVSLGDAVVAYRVRGGYATDITVRADDVFAKPASLGDAEAANLLLVGATAADLLRVVPVDSGDTVLVHGASGSVGVSYLQQARRLGARLIGTTSDAHADKVRGFGGEPVAYGPGLADRVRALAPGGVTAAIDVVGTDEALDVSLELVGDPTRIGSAVGSARARDAGIRLVGGSLPESAAFRDTVRAELLRLAGAGELVVPIARTFPLAEAQEALRLVAGGHPGGKVALIP